MICIIISLQSLKKLFLYLLSFILIFSGSLTMNLTGNTALAATNKITFSGPYGDVFGPDGIATDGEGGSTDIPGIKIQVFGIDNTGTKLSTGKMHYYDGAHPEWPGYPPLITWFDGNNTPSYGLAIKSEDGTNFKLSSVNFLDWGYWTGENFIIEAFENGISKGGLPFVGNIDGNYIALDHSSILTSVFDNIDEVRIYSASRLEDAFVSVNDIVIDDATAETITPVISNILTSNLTQTTAAVSATSNVDGTIHYVIAKNSIKPSSSEVVQGNHMGGPAIRAGSGTVTAGLAKSFNVSGLEAGTEYYGFFVSSDSSNNVSDVYVESFSTLANSYTVTFKDWNNTTLKIVAVNQGSNATAPASPTRIGYTFTGWDVSFANVTASMTVTAQYKANEYTVNFESDEGSAVGAIHGDYGTLITAPTDPTRTGYHFDGWYKEAAITNKWDFANDTMPVGGTTLHAKWIAGYNVTYSGNGATGGSVPIDKTEYGPGEVVKVKDNSNSLTKSGYRFVGWSTEPSGNGIHYAASATFAIHANVILYARWDSIPIIPSEPGTTSNQGNSTPLMPNKPEITDNSMNILINGKRERIGAEANTSKVNDQLVTTITLDQKRWEERIKNDGPKEITIPVTDNSDIVILKLSGQMINDLQDSQAGIVIQTGNASYKLPAGQINMQQLASQFGEGTNILDIKVQIEIAGSTLETMETVEYSASKGNFTVLVPPVSFTVTATYGDKSFELSKFNTYVERLITLPEGIDPNKVTTGIVVEQDGTARHVPTKVILRDGKHYAQMKSMTNSTYAVIWHPLEFADVKQHWAKAAVNDMGARMVIRGSGNDLFNPDQDITRAEFAAIIIRGLGLQLDSRASSFKDVKSTDWYSSGIQTAYSYGLINGYVDGTFRPNDKITREQAMLIVGNAMKITGLNDKLPSAKTDEILNRFNDANDVSEWAKSSVAENIQSEIISGRNDARIVPKANITRAEVAVIIQKLLQKSDLI
ncbi:InlB B-repeat-containing protein [Paenibacillus dokdonensis]|uniref:InlB B-repeat-containing protein n=1 Tax=Paenibacillus dokdonensis TaxID=2567944 RepID=UPI0010A7D3A5|nr:InlB B-repeat-containing protein [Paenibacillus dokdonensis]